MISPELEEPRPATGPGFFDSVTIDFCDAAGDLFGFARIMRLPEAARVEGRVLLFRGPDLAARVEVSGDDPGSWDRAGVDGLAATIEAPLERWTLSLDSEHARLRLEAVAVSPPLDLSGNGGEELARSAGVSSYEQVCELVGSVELEGEAEPLSVRCIGERTHAWGAHDWASVECVRRLYAAGTERAVSVTAARPAGSPGHGAEVRLAHLLEPSAEPRAVGDVHVSTVYDSAGLPRSADLELRLEEEEFPLRVAGESACGLRLDDAGRKTTLSFFRWSIEGAPALGRYETVTAA